MIGSGNKTLIISNEEMNDIKKIVKSLEQCALLIKAVNQTIQTKQEKKEDFSECY